MVPVVHEALKPLSWLIGKWVTTEGRGSYPTMPDFNYHEEIQFDSVGQPMLNFMSTSKHPEKKNYMHQERGFLRIKPGTNDLAFVVSHNFGLTSVEEGTVNPNTKEITLKSTNVSRMSFTKTPYVRSFERKFKLVGDTLQMQLYMETDTTPLTLHLQAVYKRVCIEQG